MENASSGNQSGGQITVAVNPLSDNIASNYFENFTLRLFLNFVFFFIWSRCDECVGNHDGTCVFQYRVHFELERYGRFFWTRHHFDKVSQFYFDAILAIGLIDFNWMLRSYAVSLGLVDRLARHIGGVRGPLDNHSASNEFLLVALKFLTSLVDLLYRW